MTENAGRQADAGLDDRVLLQLAMPVKSDLAAWLSRAPMMHPLAICLGFLPALFLLPFAELDEPGARFGLMCLREAYDYTSLETQASAAIAEEASTSDDNSRIDLGYLIPIWLTSRLIALTGAGGYHILLVVPLCSLVLTTYLLWKFVSLVFDPRRALLTCLLFVSTPFFLAQTMIPHAHCLGLACLIGSLWGWLVHLEGNGGYFSKSLFAGGLAWGLSFLTGGASAWIALVMAILLTDRRCHAWISRVPPEKANLEEGTRARDWGSLGIWAATGLTCGFVISLSLSGFDFGRGTTGTLPLSSGSGVRADSSSPDEAEDAAPAPPPATAKWILALTNVWTELGWLSGFALCGLIRTLMRRDTSGSAGSVRHRAIFPLWVAVGLSTYFISSTLFAAEHASAVLKCWLNVGWVLLAAGELDALLKRRHGWWSIACIWLVSMSLMSLSFTDGSSSPFQDSPSQLLWWGSLVVVLTVAVMLLLINPKQLKRERWLTGVMIVWPLFAQYVQVVPLKDWRRGELHQLETFCRELMRVSNASRSVFISQRHPPLEMQYMVASYDPRIAWEILPESETLSNHMAKRLPSLGTALVIHWGEAESLLRLLRSEGLDFQTVSTPRFFAHRELHAVSVNAKSLEQAGVNATPHRWPSPHIRSE
ncbi:MAG: ArnT family glycosyltransferase [Planctomycetaceae bacterium]